MRLESGVVALHLSSRLILVREPCEVLQVAQVVAATATILTGSTVSPRIFHNSTITFLLRLITIINMVELQIEGFGIESLVVQQLQFSVPGSFTLYSRTDNQACKLGGVTNHQSLQLSAWATTGEPFQLWQDYKP